MYKQQVQGTKGINYGGKVSSLELQEGNTPWGRNNFICSWKEENLENDGEVLG